MRLLSTRIRPNDVPKHKNNDKRGCYAQERMQMILLSTKTTRNEVAKPNKEGN